VCNAGLNSSPWYGDLGYPLPYRQVRFGMEAEWERLEGRRCLGANARACGETGNPL